MPREKSATFAELFAKALAPKEPGYVDPVEHVAGIREMQVPYHKVINNSLSAPTAGP